MYTTRLTPFTSGQIDGKMIYANKCMQLFTTMNDKQWSNKSCYRTHAEWYLGISWHSHINQLEQFKVSLSNIHHYNIKFCRLPLQGFANSYFSFFQVFLQGKTASATVAVLQLCPVKLNTIEQQTITHRAAKNTNTEIIN